MKYSVALTENLDAQFKSHLVRVDGQEDLCFGIWVPSNGKTRTTFILKEILLPREGDRNVHGNVSFNTPFFERAMDRALETGGGIAFLHSHPASGWQDMSYDDIKAEQLLTPSSWGATNKPLLGLTLGAHTGTWSARAWVRTGKKQFTRHWCESVRVVGDCLSVDFNDKLLPVPKRFKTQVRTVSAWGTKVQDTVTRITVGVVGGGSVGSIIAEGLARTGFRVVKFFDYQDLEEANLDRTLHAERGDIGKPKIAIMSRAYRKSATSENVSVEECSYSICEEEGYRKALDCDVLFSCVDRPWGRSVLNFIAYAHLIPVIDGGILVSRTNSGKFQGADWKAHVVGPGHKCLRCLDQYDPGLVEADRRGDLENTSYLNSLPGEHPAKRNENVFIFSLGVASLELLHLVSLIAKPSGLGYVGGQSYHMTTGGIDLDQGECDADCSFPGLAATGEEFHPGTGVHIPAVEARESRKKEKSFFSWLF